MFAFSSQFLQLVWAGSNLGFFIIGFIIAAFTMKKGIYISKYYLLASFGMSIGIFIFIATRNNLLPLPITFWTLNSVNLGILWEALILAATVGYRFSYLKAEKEKEKSIMRNQIASDLHDEIGSNLSTIYLQSRLMMKAMHVDNNLKEQLLEIANTARVTTETIRDIVWFINPFHDSSKDLVIRMKELASKMLLNLDYTFTSLGGNENIFDNLPDLNKRRNVHFIFKEILKKVIKHPEGKKETDLLSIIEENENIFDRLPDLNKRRHVYLIYKEILTNLVKHSEADKAHILLSIEDKKFIMIVDDNGKGFIEKEILPGDGLKNLKNRASLAGAKILIESNGGKGTKIILEVPL